MPKKKRSFFERLTGGVALDDNFDAFDDEFVGVEPQQPSIQKKKLSPSDFDEPEPMQEDEPEEASAGQLPVDVYQNENEIVIRSFVAGVRSDSLDISITRDMVTIGGAREPREDIDPGDYFHQELYWGTFSRTILLPQEVDVDGASASAKDGLLTLILPKLDKSKQTKLKVKSG